MSKIFYRYNIINFIMRQEALNLWTVIKLQMIKMFFVLYKQASKKILAKDNEKKTI